MMDRAAMVMKRKIAPPIESHIAHVGGSLLLLAGAGAGCTFNLGAIWTDR